MTKVVLKVFDKYKIEPCHSSEGWNPGSTKMNLI